MALLPGWDAEPSIPRGVIDDENADLPHEPEGYFAKLRSHRHSGGGGAGDSHGPALSRGSAPLQHVPRSATMSAAAAAAAIGVKGMPQPPHHPAGVTRTCSMPYGSPGSHAAANAGGLLQPHKYQFTDWANELSSLGGGKHPQHHAKGGTHAEAQHSGDKHHGAAWWRALEAGQLNELPESEAAAAGARGKHGGGQAAEHGRAGAHVSSFVPQFTNKQQLDFGSVGSGAGGGGASSGGDTGVIAAGDGI
ncbi:hypothetical protein HYH02_000342 [Chlamydomonas schloesseri]|uniref:Uncharacterized protein n=1 Tax=Chlamydomonas schloesseri TaxID=2026947 RepID=A0A836B818_9CHLO|nr:hypothetical protein HYH02_000342 [Chlamydomonas schloesseri]|eukprot:KAG2450245.1 hypothetical protein HYH02_000342 [Chlamydomonas schloesseri]